MRPHSSSAILTSLILHAFVAAVIFVTTIFVARTTEAGPKIIELVAGPATDMNSLEAPAEGVPNPVTMNVPAVKLPPDPEPPQVEQTPAVPEPPVTKAPPKTETVIPPTKAKADTSLAKQMNKQAKTSYKEFLKKNPIKKQSAVSQVRSGTKVPRIDPKGIVGGVKGGSTTSKGGQGGKAMTREEADQMSVYFSFLMQEVKRAYEAPAGVNDQLVVTVTFDITASGAILNPKVTKSSGNRQFDEAVLDAFRRVRSIGPTPNRRPDTWTLSVRMADQA